MAEDNQNPPEAPVLPSESPNANLPASAPVVSENKPSGKGRPKITLLIMIVLLGLLVVSSYAFGFYKPLMGVFNKIAQKEPIPTPTAEVTAVPTKEEASPVDGQGITWITPVKLTDLNLFVRTEGQPQDAGYIETIYYKIGSTSSGADIILADVKISGMGISSSVHRFLKQEDKYYYLPKNSATINSYDGYHRNYSIPYNDSDYVIKSLLPDEIITVGQTDLARQNIYGEMVFGNDSGDKKVGTTKWGDLYKKEANKPVSVNLTTANYYVLLGDSTRAYYNPKPVFARDDGTFDVSWPDEKGKATSFSMLPSGKCGLFGSFPVLVNGESAIKSAKPISLNLYVVDDQNNDLVKEAYQYYTMDNMPDKKPISDFAAEYGTVLWKDSYGSVIIFTNKKFLPAVECAKPVIYLYPIRDASISLSLGAEITKSEPTYKNGWNVLAKTNGDILDNGKVYPYLYWDGLGLGVYPEITVGTIVETEKAPETIRMQLSYIGLNDKEISDFLEFWLPKLPRTKYTRLTWLQNREMDLLAPIYVNPRPDSIIRAFLDFEGLDEPTKIEPQKLLRMNRSGFVLVEWGGLLVGGN